MATMTSRFSIRPSDDNRESFAEYRYGIYDGDTVLAHYWHDYRGDEHGIEFVLNGSYDLPFNNTIKFLDGGGPEPLRLSIRAIDWLTQRIGL